MQWSGYSAIIWAACNGHSDVVKLLLEKGVDINEKSYNVRVMLRMN